MHNYQLQLRPESSEHDGCFENVSLAYRTLLSSLSSDGVAGRCGESFFYTQQELSNLLDHGEYDVHIDVGVKGRYNLTIKDGVVSLDVSLEEPREEVDGTLQQLRDRYVHCIVD
ncbi:TPA: hypothetical protein HA278_02765 [Candidatus Woesearchaeota archaeon]|jgi:hypothetical protein|nr:hypothetical protein [archaeon]HIJ10955.1 hypothetical protein [Candidatus Woesearchaeota archaeon]